MTRSGGALAMNRYWEPQQPFVATSGGCASACHTRLDLTKDRAVNLSMLMALVHQVCGGDWREHNNETGGFYSCNRFVTPGSNLAADADPGDSRAQQASNSWWSRCDGPFPHVWHMCGCSTFWLGGCTQENLRCDAMHHTAHLCALNNIHQPSG